MGTFLVHWLPVALWMALIFYLSSSRFTFGKTARFVEPLLRLLFRKINSDRLTLAHIRVREAAHFGEYIVLSLLVFRAVRGDHPATWQASWMWSSLAISTVYAVFDETHQKWEAGRTPKVEHVLIDVAGIVTAQVLIILCVGAP